MPDPVTTRFGLPLMQASQAQKHVTLNESLMRLDGVANLVVQSLGRTTPPEVVNDGVCYGLGSGAVNAWSGQDGKLAIGAGGGWVFVQPTAGLRARNLATGREAIHSGKAWIEGAVTLSATGAGMIAGLAEADVTLTSGASVTTTLAIPSNCLIIGASARVIEAITGTCTSWQLGTTGALNRFGSGLGKPLGSFARGLLSAPMVYANSDPLIATATGGTFTGGRLRLAVHWWELRLPD